MIDKTYTIQEEQNGLRIDIALSELHNISRSQATKLVRSGRISLNGEDAKKTGKKVKLEDTLSISVLIKDPKDEEDSSIYEQINIIADTKDYIVVYKPADLLVHPTMKGEKVTLADWLVNKFPEVVGVGESDVRPGIVHRLDKDASGLLVIAKNQKTFLHLKNQFKERTVEKYYTVLVHGRIENEHQKIDFDIDRGKEGKMVARPKTNKLDVTKVTKVQPGKESLTEYWNKKQFVNYTLLRVKIHTGRTHQIRVHMFATSHPVVGDRLYQNKKLISNRDKKIGRLFLHATELSFLDRKGEKQTYHAELPEKLQAFLEELT